MENYYYIGLVETTDGIFNRKALVKSEDGCYLHPGNVVAFHDGDRKCLSVIKNVSFISKGSEEEAILAELAPVFTVEEIYNFSWQKAKEDENDGN